MPDTAEQTHAADPEVVDRVKGVLEQIRPALQMDGGDLEFIEMDDDGVVKLHLVGACVGCPMSTMTLAMGIERMLKHQVPEVSNVITV